MDLRFKVLIVEQSQAAQTQKKLTNTHKYTHTDTPAHTDIQSHTHTHARTNPRVGIEMKLFINLVSLTQRQVQRDQQT